MHVVGTGNHPVCTRFSSRESDGEVTRTVPCYGWAVEEIYRMVEIYRVVEAGCGKGADGDGDGNICVRVRRLY